MKSILSILLFIFIIINLSAQLTFDQKTTEKKVMTLLSKLDDAQRLITILDYGDDSRSHWSNLPMEEVNRKGMMVKDMNDAQRIALHDVLRNVLSQQGYQKALFIMQYDEGTHERLKKMFNPIANRYGRHNYWFAVYGEPIKDKTWAFKFEGHHLSLNFSFSEGLVICTPMFTGINPALSRSGENAGTHIMFDEQELGNQLFTSFSATQRKKSIVGGHPKDADVKTKNGNEAHLFDKRGVLFTEMLSNQKLLVEKIIKSWVENLNPILAQTYIQHILNNQDDIIFKWFGTEDINDLHYYAIQSHDFIIEFTHRDGGIDHYHTLWYGLTKK